VTVTAPFEISLMAEEDGYDQRLEESITMVHLSIAGVNLEND
jgi:hypothetical protein